MHGGEKQGQAYFQEKKLQQTERKIPRLESGSTACGPNTILWLTRTGSRKVDWKLQDTYFVLRCDATGGLRGHSPPVFANITFLIRHNSNGKGLRLWETSSKV